MIVWDLLQTSVIDISEHAGEWNEEIYYCNVIGEGKMMGPMVVIFQGKYVNIVLSIVLYEWEDDFLGFIPSQLFFTIPSFIRNIHLKRAMTVPALIVMYA